MENLEKEFENVKDSDNPDEINDFLIKLGKNPQHNHITFLKYFIEITDPEIHEQIKMNLVYDLGELGKLKIIDVRFIDYLMKEYYNSDRWIRNEIIVAFKKISIYTELSEKVKELLGNSLKENYNPIKMNALKALLHIDNVSKYVLEKVLIVLNIPDIELEKMSSNVLKKNVLTYKNLFDLLNNSENYKRLKKKGIRVLLLEFFNSLIQLGQFKEKISKSNWNNKQKLIFLAEIDVFEHILLKNL